MPVKVRCECGAGISAPDAARGKVIKCRKCGQPVRVPKGKPSGDGEKPRRKKAAAPRPSVDDEDFFAAIDLEGGEDLDVRICPKCATEVDEEDIECPACGVNLDTGMLSAKQKKKRKNKGPDPDDYPKVVWKDSMAFLKKNMSLAVRLSLTFSVFLTVFLATLYMATVYCIPEDPTNPDTPVKVPVLIFWGFISLLSGSASVGCFCQLAILIIKATMDQRDSLERFNFDFFVSVAMGLKIYSWSYVFMWPVTLPAIAVTAYAVGVFAAFQGENGGLAAVGSEMASSFAVIAVGSVLYLIPFWTFPAAFSHMAAQYTWRAYIPYFMFKYGARATKGVAVWWLVAFVTMLPALAVLVPSAIFAREIYDGFGSLLVKLVGLCGIETEAASRGFMFDLTSAAIGLPTLAISAFIIALLIAFPAVFLMRTTGLFSYYNQRELGLGEKRKEEEPAGFWARYLAYTIDSFILGVFITIKSLIILFMLAAANYLEMEGMGQTLGLLDRLTSLLIIIVYYVFTEGGQMRGTLGKSALGLVVTDEKGNSPISRGAAFGRLFYRGIGYLLLGIGWLMCVWDPEKKTLHDKMTKTKVMWSKLTK